MTRRGGLVLSALLALSACAPTSLAPTVIRYEPLEPSVGENRLGLRTGPRLSSAIARVEGGTLDDDIGTPAPPELGLGLEYVRLQPLIGNFAVHFGVQAEFFYAIPFPALGAFAGLSHRWQIGVLSIAPGLGLRAGTDFGTITAAGPPASTWGGDVSVSISLAEGETARIGVSPFFALWQTYSPTASGLNTAAFAGAVLFVRFTQFELIVGLGRVFAKNTGWNVPLIGVRTGGN
ncbi:MAG: hypothetical protein JNM17_38080 [Archangium sp.]|nr:hypothetical protein [Archangium sp.]